MYEAGSSTDSVCTPPLTKRAQDPQEVIQPIITKRPSIGWCGSCRCVYIQSPPTPGPISPFAYDTDYMTWQHAMKYKQMNFPVMTTPPQHTEASNVYVNVILEYWGGSPTFTEALLVNPVAISNMISRQSGLILHSNVIAPDKHFLPSPAAAEGTCPQRASPPSKLPLHVSFLLLEQKWITHPLIHLGKTSRNVHC